ncbi:MAG: hypothetical protein R3285_10400, partial [Kiloniellales bacterium]|nr:hypothetical protein [Kiloniellales bacterium]
PMRSTFQFVQRVPCNGDKSGKDCVELEMRTFIDPEGLAAAVEAFVAKLPGDQPAPRIEELRQETVVRLISEPGTLLPHLLETSTRSATTVSVGDQSQSSSQIEEKRFVYTY